MFAVSDEGGREGGREGVILHRPQDSLLAGGPRGPWGSCEDWGEL